MEKIEDSVDNYIVACEFKNVSDRFEWAFANVYFPNSDIELQLLQELLPSLISWWNWPWCIGGDFNVTHLSSERSGEANFSFAMDKFSDFIFEQDLMHIPLQGWNSTWSNNWDSHSWSRIDKFLISPGWEDHFLNVSHSRLPTTISDLFPILFDCGDFQRGKS